MILIGSQAMNLRGVSPGRKPSDFDYVCTKAEFDSWLNKNRTDFGIEKVYEVPEHNKWIAEGAINCEFEIITTNKSTEVLSELVSSDPLTVSTDFGKIPSLDILFAIKDSHKYKKFQTPLGAQRFYKTAFDWHKMKAYGATLKDAHKELHALRKIESGIVALPKLNVSKNEFFDTDKTGVNQIYDHDELHKVVALGDKPAYASYLKDGEQVLTDKQKFFAVDESVRLAGVFEESCVLALERSLIPHKKDDQPLWSTELAFKFALAKVCTTITGGYFRKYAFDNVLSVLKMYKSHSDFYERFLIAEKTNKILKKEAI